MDMPIRLLVFDLDGTLVDSKEDLASSVNFAIGRAGVPALPRETIYTFIGDGAAMLVRRALGPVHEDRTDEVLGIFLDHYRGHLLDKTLPFPGVRESLGAHASRYRMAVLTNKPIGMTEAILSGLSLDGFFSEVRGGDSFGTKKPDPEGLVRVMASQGAASDETLMVGDSRNDVLAGRGAGTRTCGVTYGLGAGGFAAAPPDFTVDRFPDIFRRIRPKDPGGPR